MLICCLNKPGDGLLHNTRWIDWLIDWKDYEISEMLWVTQHLQHVRVSEASWRMHLSLTHQSDESYRRGVHINRRSSHSLSVIFIHIPNRISILTSEFPPLLKQVDLLSVVLLAWIFNRRVVLFILVQVTTATAKLNLNWDTETDFFSLFELTTCCFYNIFSYLHFYPRITSDYLLTLF